MPDLMQCKKTACPGYPDTDISTIHFGTLYLSPHGAAVDKIKSRSHVKYSYWTVTGDFHNIT